MASPIEKGLARIAKIQKRHTNLLLIIVLLFSIFMAIGATKVWIQPDMDKEMPQELPIFQLNNLISDKFGGQEATIIELRLDPESNEPSGVKDVRDPRVFAMFDTLQGLLEDEGLIASTTSPAMLLQYGQVTTLEEGKALVSSIPGASDLYNKDYSITVMYLFSNAGDSQEKIRQVTRLIERKIDETPLPTGVEVRVTGGPVLQMIMIDLLNYDIVYTMLLAAAIILVLLFVMERSIPKGILIFMPLLLGILWTLGALGWLDIPINIATGGLGAMILGLGVEYGVFIVSRYKEERAKGKGQEAAIVTALPAAGGAMVGSSLTTIIGFLALTLGIMPMMQHLGQTLALGIFFSIAAALLVNPLFMLKEEDFEAWFTQKMHDEFTLRKQRHVKQEETIRRARKEERRGGRR